MWVLRKKTVGESWISIKNNYIYDGIGTAGFVKCNYQQVSIISYRKRIRSITPIRERSQMIKREHFFFLNRKTLTSISSSGFIVGKLLIFIFSFFYFTRHVVIMITVELVLGCILPCFSELCNFFFFFKNFNIHCYSSATEK